MVRSRPFNLGLAALLFVTALTFAPCLTGDFVYDDLRFIAQNPYMTAPFDLAAAFTDPSTMEQGTYDIYRPLRTLAFRIEHGLGDGKPFLHHLAGIVIHLINTVLVYLLVRRISEFATGTADFVKEGNAGNVTALLGAAVFALHPLQAESVAWISSRGDQLVAFFVLLTLNLTFRHNGKPALLMLPITFALTLLACLSKESGMILGALILSAWLCIRALRTRNILLHGVIALVAAGIYFFIRSATLGPLEGQVPYHGGTWTSNAMYALYGIGYQAMLVLRPWFSNLDYQDGFFDAVPFTRIVILGCLFPALALLFLGIFRKKGRAIFGLLFSYVCLLPTSSLVFPLRSLVNDRYLYLAMAGVAILIASGLSTIMQRERARPLTGLVFMVVLSLLGGLSFARSMHWQSDERLWQATLKTHPLSTKARVGLSRAWFNQGKVEESLRMTDEALDRLQPGSSLRTDTLYLKAQALCRLGRIDEAATCLELAVEESASASDMRDIRDRLILICKNLWDLRMKANDFNGARRASEALIRIEGETAQNLWFKGRSLRMLKQEEEAEAVLRKGVVMKPACVELFLELADLLTSKGRMEEANSFRQKGLELIENMKSVEGQGHGR